MNMARQDKKMQTVTLDSAFLGEEAPGLVPAAGLEAGVVLEIGGKGGSDTSES